jgi:hypothetical protein
VPHDEGMRRATAIRTRVMAYFIGSVILLNYTVALSVLSFE